MANIRASILADSVSEAGVRLTTTYASDADGLRRIGVAVAVWGAMAAVRDSDFFVRLAEARARSATTRAGIWRQRCAKMSRELEAERAARRKWEMRLRWRAEQPPNALDADRLRIRAWRYPFGGALLPGASGKFRHLPISGPRGVLP